MKTLFSFLNGQTEKATINSFEDASLTFNLMSKVRGGDGDPGGDPQAGETWIPDEEEK
jgi:hypothetical protein